jgi:hypothetical protein
MPSAGKSLSGRAATLKSVMVYVPIAKALITAQTWQDA